MNGHFGIDDAIRALLFNTLIEGGIAKLKAKLHAVKHQTLVAVADGNGRVVESLKQGASASCQRGCPSPGGNQSSSMA